MSKPPSTRFYAGVALTAIILVVLVSAGFRIQTARYEAFWASRYALKAWQDSHGCNPDGCPDQQFGENRQIDSTIEAWSDSEKVWQDRYKQELEYLNDTLSELERQLDPTTNSLREERESITSWNTEVVVGWDDEVDSSIAKTNRWLVKRLSPGYKLVNSGVATCSLFVFTRPSYYYPDHFYAADIQVRSNRVIFCYISSGSKWGEEEFSKFAKKNRMIRIPKLWEVS